MHCECEVCISASEAVFCCVFVYSMINAPLSECVLYYIMKPAHSSII